MPLVFISDNEARNILVLVATRDCRVAWPGDCAVEGARRVITPLEDGWLQVILRCGVARGKRLGLLHSPSQRTAWRQVKAVSSLRIATTARPTHISMPRMMRPVRSQAHVARASQLH